MIFPKQRSPAFARHISAVALLALAAAAAQVASKSYRDLKHNNRMDADEIPGSPAALSEIVAAAHAHLWRAD